MALPPIPDDIVQLTGPMLIGHLINWGLFGALSLQVYLYYLSFPNDKSLTKATVAVVYALEVIQTIIAARDAFRDLGSGWGNMVELNKIGWIWFSAPVMSSIISCLAQLFYARRIWIISKKLWVPIIVILLALTQGIAGIVEGVEAHRIGIFSTLQRSSYKVIAVWLGGTALCDIIIAGSMLYYLYTSRTGFRATNLLLARMIRITVETGLICAAFAVLDLALDLRYPDNNYHLSPAIALSKLYSNSLLAVLNARIRIVGGRGENEPIHHSMGGSTLNSVQLPKLNRTTPRSNGVTVTISHDETIDGFDLTSMPATAGSKDENGTKSTWAI